MRVIEGAACVPTFAQRSRSVLPIELIRKYENESFWLDPAPQFIQGEGGLTRGPTRCTQSV
jgi:hypothetical protein